MTLESYILFSKIQSVLSALNVVLAFIYFNKRQVEVKLIGLTCLLNLLGDFAWYFFPLKGKDVNLPGHIASILIFIILCVLFNFVLKGKHKTIILWVCFIFCCFAIANLLFGQKKDINSYNQIASAIIFIFFSIFYFYRLLIDLPALQLHRLPMFWFCTSILIFNAGTLFLSVFTAYLVEVLHNDFLFYGTFLIIMYIIQHLVVMIGLWQDLRNIKSPSSLPSAQ
ncbi:hypothetical protein SAMN05660236_3089 [Ohtaekwangia koreensis]|uniref:YhhN-like protein n=1 Tax=Ohtaekwangia koreensis TaxID=688867 RepID=A0A1T5LEZ2_9BACT|nr:hypothetical protein SAMN05660236_3089 [Ohtaekwangia koreensis]